MFIQELLVVCIAGIRQEVVEEIVQPVVCGPPLVETLFSVAINGHVKMHERFVRVVWGAES